MECGVKSVNCKVSSVGHHTIKNVMLAMELRVVTTSRSAGNAIPEKHAARHV